MVGRGSNRAQRGRGGNFKKQIDRNNTSIHSRLGTIPTYQNANDSRNLGKGRFKYVSKAATVTTSLAPLPPEARVRSLSKKFLKTYYEIFDQPGRANLESQYGADSFFSVSATTPLPTVGRNLIEVLDPAERITSLYHNKTNIAVFLANFPPTEHLVNFLSCDVPYYVATPMSISSMQIVVSGVFKDTSLATNSLRAFTRVFLIKQVLTDKQGEPVYEIFNDLFMLQSPTPDQIKRYHHEAQIIKRVPTTNQPNSSSVDSNNTPSQRVQNSMIQSIMAKTKMNLEHSKKILEETKWNEANAVTLFEQLNAQGAIPQECFAP